MLLHEKLKPYHLILASGSPRRRQLIQDCGLEVTVADQYSVEEHYPDSLAPAEVPLFLSKLKSNAYPTPLGERELLITADTAVILKGHILGKPADRDAAIASLTRLSGEQHEVITGVTLRDKNRSYSFSTVSEVTFKRLSLEEITYYVDTYRPYDKAGAYGIQEWIGYVGIESIRGSYNNIVGLPVQQLLTELERFVK